MQTMGTLILIFAVSIGTATFIENDFGTFASKAVVYNTTWFNILLLVLTVNLVGRIIIGKMYKLKKITVFTFHVAFIIILIGAGITRFISYEGIMHIREGVASNSMLSDNSFVEIKIEDGDKIKTVADKVFLSTLTPNDYGSSVSLNNKEYSFKSVKYVPNASEIITESDKDGDPYIVMVFSDGRGRQNYYLKYGQSEWLGNKKLNFADGFIPEAINIKIVDGELQIFSTSAIVTLSMATSQTDTLDISTWHSFEMRKLYSIDGANIVLTNFYKNGVIDYVTYDGKGSMMNALVVKVDNGTETKDVVLLGGKGYKGEVTSFIMDDAKITMTYGAKEILLPFSVRLNEFQLERYAGSMSPSSYASEVTLIDEKKNINIDYRIYMNHVLNYGGYRFFQSSYDSDEQGTILSVAHDYWGTFFTYLGYFLMSLGMLLSIFSRNTQLAALGRVIKKKASSSNIKSITLLATLLISTAASAQEVSLKYVAASNTSEVPKQLAYQFGQLLVQSQDGRLKPVNTLAGEVLRKISRKSKLDGLDADQVFLGMMTYPREWQQVAMIKVTHPELKKLLGIDGYVISLIMM